jgi:DNA replication licensing factor MCM5
VVVFGRIQFEDAAREVADEVTKPRPEGEEEVQDIQVMMLSAAHPTSIRALKVSPR